MANLTVALGIVLLLFASRHSTDGAKILLIPFDHGSHVNFFLVAGQTLAAAGHDVHALTVARHQKAVDKFGIKGMILKPVKGKAFIEENYEELEELLFQGGRFYMMKLISKFTSSFVEQCKEILESDALWKQLKDAEFDLVLIDGIDVSRCMYIIPYKLGVKYVTFNARQDPWTVRVPAMPSVEPPWPVMHFEGDPSFWERLASLAVYTALSVLLPPSAIDDRLIAEYAPEKPTTTFTELFTNSELWLINVENLCLDMPRVYAPHYQFVGGINTHPAKPLPSDLETFVSDAPNGVIILTFGSAIKRVPPNILQRLMAAFKTLDYKIIMRFDGDAQDVPSNVKLSKWLPQNDVLGHPNTKLFITHAGNNGLLEALYHGVPMLFMPIGGDQPFNARRLELHGYGKTVNPHDFTPEELVSAINELMTNSSYREKIQYCSKIYRDFPSAQQTIQFYVDHVLKFGGSHLKPKYLHMPLWRFFMLDVLLFVVIVSTVTAVLIMVCCRSVYRRCTGASQKKPSKVKQN